MIDGGYYGWKKWYFSLPLDYSAGDSAYYYLYGTAGSFKNERIWFYKIVTEVIKND